MAIFYDLSNLWKFCDKSILRIKIVLWVNNMAASHLSYKYEC